MPRHYSYRVDHDLGFAPHIARGVCTLCGCKTTTIEKWAEPGSWIVGIGGNGTGRPNALIYAMEVEETPSYAQFSREHCARAAYLDGRGVPPEAAVLVSRHFFFFGDRARRLPPKLTCLVHPTQGCKRLSDEDIALLNKHVLGRLRPGKYGKPNNALPTMQCENRKYPPC
jgi:hypothetical protein